MNIRAKIIIFILITLMILGICNTVKAATSYNVELSCGDTTVKQGQQIEIIINLKDIVNITDGVAGMSAKLEYDTNKLERIGEAQGLNGFLIVEGDTIELAKYPGVTDDTELAQLTFKIKENATEEAIIKLTGVEIVNGTDVFKLGKDVTKTILIIENNVLTEKLSNNNNLLKLSVDGTQISNFNKDTLTYTLSSVSNSKTNIEIVAEAEDAKSIVTGTGSKDLRVGENCFEVVVTAEDGSQKTYKINIERKETTTSNKENENIKKENENIKKENENIKKETESLKELPHTGIDFYIVLGVFSATLGIGIISFIKIKKLSGI